LSERKNEVTPDMVKAALRYIIPSLAEGFPVIPNRQIVYHSYVGHMDIKDVTTEQKTGDTWFGVFVFVGVTEKAVKSWQDVLQKFMKEIGEIPEVTYQIDKDNI